MSAVTAPVPEVIRRRVVSDRITYLFLAALAYVPLLRMKPDIIGADTKHYLYLDPDQLMNRAASVWDPNVGLGTVSHQNVGYLWPMGPWYSIFQSLGVADWVTQRLWLGTLLFAAGAGVMFLLRQLDMRGLGASIAALSYMLSPYVLAYAARISAILLPWAGLPWLIGLFVLALRRGGWRWPAAFALVVTTIGSINASSLFFVAIGVVVWVPYAVWHLREIDLRTAGRTMTRIGILTAVTQVWWIVALLLSSTFGPPVLQSTESYQAVSTSSLSTEVLRGLGNWFFYGRDAVGPWVEASVPYTQEGWLMAISFILPIIAFGAAAIVRWQHRAYFTTLIVLGAVIGVAAFPFDDPSPFGAVTKALTDQSSLALALRNAQRAIPLLALGVAALLGSLVNAIGDRVAWGRVLSAAPLGLLILANFPALWSGGLVDSNLQRPQELPSYLTDAAAHLDAQGDGSRVLELPGTDFAAYRFGNTVDPVLPGLMDRPWVGRESGPQGTEGSINLVGALDRRLQEGTFEPASLAPLARLMNVGDVVIRGDLQTERYRTPRPSNLAELFRVVPDGLGDPVEFGRGVPNVAPPELPLVDELELGRDPALDDAAAITVFPVRSGRPVVMTAAGTNQVILSGDGDGIVDAASAGLIDGKELLFYSADLATFPSGLDGIVFDADAHVILTDTNRRRAQRFTTLRENTGATETADERPLAADASDARIPLFRDAPDDGDPAQSVTQFSGVASIRATSYGNVVAYIPEERPSAAFDDDLTTAWRTAAAVSPIGERVRVDFTDARTLSELTLVQPRGQQNRFITRVRLHFTGMDGGTTTLDARLDDSSRTDEGQTITFPPVEATAVAIEVTADSVGPRGDYGGFSAVGFAEVRIPGVAVTERVRLPTDVLARAGGHSGPLTVVLTRLRANPAEPVRSDPEHNIERQFALPDTPLGSANYVMSGTIRLAAQSTDDEIDRIIGRPDQDAGGITSLSSSRLAGSLASRASSALDGDPETSWVPSFGPQVGQFVQFDFADVTTIAHLDLAVVADAHHSLPTRLRLRNELGEEAIVDVPPMTRASDLGAIQTRRIEIPGGFTFAQLRVTIDAVDPLTTIEYFSRAPVELPVGIVELGLSAGEVVAAPVADLATPCRTGLLTVDGADVPIALTGTTADALARKPISFKACGDPIRLGEGDHDVSTEPGTTSGVDIDRVVIDRLLIGDPLTAADRLDRGPDVRTTVAGPAGFDLTLRDVADPFFLVLGESYSDAWSATDDGGASVSDPIRLNGFATAWYVDPSQRPLDGPLQISLRWTPQRWATTAQRVSLAGVALCMLLLLVGRRTRHVTATDPPPALRPIPTLEFAWDHPPRTIELVPTVTVSLGAGLLAALLIAPVAGPLLACLGIVMGLRPRFRALLPIGAALFLALGAMIMVVVEMWKQYPLGFGWAANYEPVHPLGWLAVALLALNTALEVVAARSAPPREVRGP